MCYPINSSAENLLASTDDLLSLLAQFGMTYPRRSSERRNDEDLARAALFNLFQTVAPDEARPTPAVISEPAMAPPQMIREKQRPSSSPRNPTVETKDRVRTARRQPCQCGECKSCLDNARWDRIFNEKFADPTYYGPITIKHSSCLAGAR